MANIVTKPKTYTTRIMQRSDKQTSTEKYALLSEQNKKIVDMLTTIMKERYDTKTPPTIKRLHSLVIDGKCVEKKEILALIEEAKRNQDNLDIKTFDNQALTHNAMLYDIEILETLLNSGADIELFASDPKSRDKYDTSLRL